MPVDERTRQLMGILHGGASVALAESIGSFAANMCVDQSRFYCVGQEINANHLRPVASGLVTATAKPFHVGTRSQVWHIEIHDERQRLVCVSRLTMAVLERQPSSA
jgi:1,4-dihydroxy-2-naphthoyl-CoA hydrolase